MLVPCTKEVFSISHASEVVDVWNLAPALQRHTKFDHIFTQLTDQIVSKHTIFVIILVEKFYQFRVQPQLNIPKHQHAI